MNMEYLFICLCFLQFLPSKSCGFHIHFLGYMYSYFIAFVGIVNGKDLKGVILSKIRQTEKDKYCMTSLTCGI